ncbi:MAG TPA: tetratricopeptide repeat protein [Terriglobales bacterium]|nr:tetratricopeptide repeat protein [Terriglobales bacterium]
MGEPSLGTPRSEPPTDDRLDSWKEIAAYLNRDVTTVQRWEKREGMPVHRHLHDRMGSVYAFSAELDVWQNSRKLRLEAEERRQEDQQKAETPVPSEGKGETTPTRQRWVVLAALAALVLFAAIYFVARSRTKGAHSPTISSVAVLPLKNLSGDPTQEYLADGMTEELIGRLSSIHNLRIISRTSVMQLKETHLSIPEIAKMLRVDAIVEGSVKREGNRIRVTAQLIRASTDDHFWSESYDGDLRDVLALEGEVAQAIARKVEVTVTGQENKRLTAVRSVAPEVYQSYLKGVFTLENSVTKADLEKSVGYFDEAINRDPTFAPAYVGLAQTYDNLGTVFVGVSPAEVRPKLIRAARKALELDPQLADAHVLLADVYQKQWQWDEAEAEYKRALELSPSDASAQANFADWMMCQGRTEEALVWAQGAREHDPLAVSGLTIGWILFQAHRYNEAIQEIRSVLAAKRDDPDALYTLAFPLIANGQAEEAIPELEKVVSASDRSPGSIELLATAYGRAGHRTEALRLIDELKRRRQNAFVPAGAFINPYMALGDHEQAFIWFERAYQEKSNILQFLKVHPFFDPVRNDPRFIDLVHRVGLDRDY